MGSIPIPGTKMNRKEAARLGGIARGRKEHDEAVVQRKLALEKYLLSPKLCQFCKRAIPVGDGSVYNARRKKFCSHSCAARSSNSGSHGRNKDLRVWKTCTFCKKEFWGGGRLYCSRACWRNDPDHPVGKQNTEISRINRYRILAHEQAEAKKLEEQGFTVFSPTAVCDRIAVKDGKIFFVEFKQPGQELRPGQQAIQDLAPAMYLIQYEKMPKMATVEDYSNDRNSSS